MVHGMSSRHTYWGLVACVAVAGASTSGAQLEVTGVFSDHAVLQQGVRVPVWGKATPGAVVSVEFAGQKKATKSSKAGEWMLHLDPLKSNLTGTALKVRDGKREISFTDLVVGEVWLASGQSNMQFSLAACASRLPEGQAAMTNPASLGVRMLRIGCGAAEHPVADIDREQYHWKTDSPNVRKGQSAAAYFFARRLHEELKVPIGIIETSWGGKPIEGFIPRPEFEKHEALKPILRLADQNKLEELKRLVGGVWVRNDAGLPGRIFNSRLAPVAPYAVRGAIWYQAESNAGVAEDPRNYRLKMGAMIEGWRRVWKQPAMPVYFVQLPGFRDEFDGWTRVREEQRLSLEIPNTGMAVTIDLRDADIHPANKIDVGERLAKWPLALHYGKKDVIPSGPLFRSARFTGTTVRVSFAHLGGGLMAARKEGLAAPKETPTTDLAHFELAGEDGVWHPALAKIASEQVVVTSTAVPKPVAVRYACSGAPKNANLYNRAGLPASPFCSRLDFLPWSPPAARKK